MADPKERFYKNGSIPVEFQPNPEETPKLEKQFDLAPDVKVLIVSGPSGTGKTSSTRALGELLDVPVFHAGEKFRKLKEDSNQIGYFERPEELDIEVDEEQRQIIEDEDSPVKIIESRLGIVIANEVEYIPEHTPSGKIVKILITAENDERMGRVIKRERKKIGMGLSDEEIIEKTLDREERDRKQWARLHPALRKYDTEDPLSWEPINPHDASTTSEDGKTFYDFVLDTTALSKDETLEELTELLLENGLITPIEESDNISNYIVTN